MVLRPPVGRGSPEGLSSVESSRLQVAGAHKVSSMNVPPGARLIWSGPGSASMIDFTGRGAFFPHWFEFLCLAAQSRDRAQQAAADRQGLPTSEALTAILFSALATEALINELPEAAARSASLHPDIPGLDALADLAATLDLTEKAQGQIDLKYQMASKILTGKTFPPGEAPFQDFANLITLRNELVHPRHRDRTTVAGHVEPASRVIRDLQQRGLTTTKGRREGDVPGGMSWLEEIKSGGAASWAYNAAHEVIVALLMMLPEDSGLPTGLLFRDRIKDIPQ